MTTMVLHTHFANLIVAPVSKHAGCCYSVMERHERRMEFFAVIRKKVRPIAT
jgi:hypothetical protein